MPSGRIGAPKCSRDDGDQAFRFSLDLFIIWPFSACSLRCVVGRRIPAVRAKQRPARTPLFPQPISVLTFCLAPCPRCHDPTIMRVKDKGQGQTKRLKTGLYDVPQACARRKDTLNTPPWVKKVTRRLPTCPKAPKDSPERNVKPRPRPLPMQIMPEKHVTRRQGPQDPLCQKARRRKTPLETTRPCVAPHSVTRMEGDRKQAKVRTNGDMRPISPSNKAPVRPLPMQTMTQ
jgi:hypothetical protein